MRSATDSPVFARLRAMLFLAVGIAVLATVGIGIGQERRYLAKAVRAHGLVLKELHGPVHVLIAFETNDGKHVEFVQGGMIEPHHAGDRVDVTYDPQSPTQSAALDSFGARWGDEIFLALLGTIFTAIGAAPLLALIAKR